MRLAAAIGCLGIVLAGCAATAGTPRDDSTTAVLLHSIVRIGDTSDTLVTAIAPGRVRVTHRSGDTILDTVANRFLVLDPATSTYRTMTLARWEESVRESPVQRGEAPADTLDFEAMEGPVHRIAGYECRRYHVFARREMFPGELEEVEEEIWVTTDLVLATPARTAWERVQASLDQVALDAPARRPPGMVLRTVVRRRPVGKGPEADEMETTEVFRIERRPVPIASFGIPSHWTRADSTSGASDAPPVRQD